MGIGAGIFLVAVGAILSYAVTAEVQGMDINTIGAILMVAGLAVTLISLVLVVATRGRADRVVERRSTSDDVRL